MNPDPNLGEGRKGAVSGTRAEPRKGTVVTAVIVIVVGVLLLLNQFDVFPRSFSLSFWPLVFMGVGAAQALTACRLEGRLWGIVLIAVGMVLELNYLHITHVEFWELWPLAVIVVGVSMLRGALGGKDADAAKTSFTSRFNSVYVFSGTDRKITAKNFQGGKISAIFGGFKIDLTRADIEGDSAVVEVHAIFGGGEIIVPETWNIVVETAGIFGAVEDKTRHFQPDASQPTKTLILKGTSVFGGIVIRNW